MNFAFTQDQTDLRAAVRQVLEAECAPADVRRALGPPDRPDGEPSRERWNVLAQLGAPGLLAPPPTGLGLGDVELVVVLEEAGRSALPEPLAETAGLLVPLLVAAGGSDARVAQHLEGLATGELLGAVGGLEITEDGWSVSTVGRPDGSAGTPRVAAGMSADAMALAATGASGPELHLLGAAETDREPVATLDPTRRLAEVAWRPSPHTLLASGDRALELLGLLADRGALTSAAQLLGVAAATPRPLGRLRRVSAGNSASPSAASKPSSTTWPTWRYASSSPVLPSTGLHGRWWPARRPDHTTCRSQRPLRRTPPTSRRAPRCRCTAPSATRGSATSSCGPSAPGLWRRPGGTPPSTGRSCCERPWPVPQQPHRPLRTHRAPEGCRSIRLRDWVALRRIPQHRAAEARIPGGRRRARGGPP